jgi:hypothetical protein
MVLKRDSINLRKALIFSKKSGFKSRFCVLAGARTPDPLIKSQLLYQLSYEDFLFGAAKLVKKRK